MSGRYVLRGMRPFQIIYFTQQQENSSAWQNPKNIFPDSGCKLGSFGTEYDYKLVSEPYFCDKSNRFKENYLVIRSLKIGLVVFLA